MKPKKEAKQVVLAIVLALAFPLFAAGESFEILPHLSITDDGVVSVSWDLASGGPGLVRWTENPDLYPSGYYVNSTATGEALKHHTFSFPVFSTSREIGYQVVSGDAVFGPYRFFSPPIGAEGVKIAVYGDCSPNDATHVALIDLMLHSRPNIVLNGGDLVEDGSELEDWKHFFSLASDLSATVPYMSAVGDNDGGILRDTYFDFPESETFYSFNMGKVAFIVLDAGQDYSPGSRQNDWLLNTLYHVPVDFWKIVVYHNAPWSSGVLGSDLSAQVFLCPIFEVYGVDIVISSSDHDYERLIYNDVTYIVTGGGGAELTSVGSISGTQYSESAFHFVEISILGEELRLQAIRSDGSLMDSYEMTSLGLSEKNVPEKSEICMSSTPNPFNSTCHIDVDIPEDAGNEWSFYLTDMNGRRISDGWKSTELSDRKLRITWDAKGLPTGVYMACFSAEDQHFMHRIILTK
jgi:hypothetical protein